MEENRTTGTVDMFAEKGNVQARADAALVDEASARFLESEDVWDAKRNLSGPPPQSRSAASIGDQTPVERFRTFPLANSASIEGAAEEAIPDFEDVKFVKEWGDENEK